MKAIGWETYDDFTREGTSKDTRALRIGTGRWRLELWISGFYVRLGSLTFVASFEWADD